MFEYPSYSKTNHSLGFFQPSIEQLPPILEGVFEYNSAFAAFLAATDQKKQTARMVASFVNELQEKKVLSEKGERIKVADLGCADSSACLDCLDHMGFAAGFEYIGFDVNDKFLKEAETALLANARIKKHELIREDVLAGELHRLPSVRPKSFDLVFVSHLAYYVKDKKYCKWFLNDILNLLNDKGMAFFLHEESTYYFRSTYNTLYTNSSAPTLLKTAVRPLLKVSGQFNEISFTSKLHFAEMSDDLWLAAKNPSRYKLFSNSPSFIDNLNKLSFIVQCDLSKLAEEGSLPRFIDEMRSILEANNNCFNLVTNMQVLVSPKNANIAEIKFALSEIENKADLIFSEANSVYIPIEPTNELSTIYYS